MHKYDVTMRWTKKIEFGTIEAADKEDAQAQAEQMLAEENNSLIEEDVGEPEFEAEEVK